MNWGYRISEWGIGESKRHSVSAVGHDGDDQTNAAQLLIRIECKSCSDFQIPARTCAPGTISIPRFNLHLHYVSRETV